MSDKPRGLRKHKDPVVIPDFLLTDEFLGAFEEFLQMRGKMKGGKDSDYAIGLCIDDIVHLSAQGLLKEHREKVQHHDKAVELVQYAIYRKWRAIFKKPVDDDWTPPGKQKQQTQQSVFIPLKKPQQSEPTKIQEAMTPEQQKKVRQTMFEHLDNIVQQSKKIPEVWGFDQVFEYMKEENLIDSSVENLKDFKKNQIRWLEMEENACKLKNDLQGQSMYKRIRTTDIELKQWCRKKMVQQYFRKKHNLMPF